MKKQFLFLVLWLLVFPQNAVLAAGDNIVTTETIFEEYRLCGAQKVFGDVQLTDSMQKLMPDFEPTTLTDRLLRGQEKGNIPDFLSDLFRFFIGELKEGKNGAVQILLISFLAGLLNVLTQSFGESGVGQVAFMPCYLIVVSIGVSLFYGVAEFVREALEFAVKFMNASLPIYTSLLMTTQTASVGILSPGITLSVFLLSNLISYVIFPAIFFSVMISIVEHLSKTLSIHRLNCFLKKTIRWILCLVGTVFAAFLSVAQIATQSLNGVGARTGKYIVSNLVPIVGGFLTETLDTLFTCAGMIRGATGLAGIVLLTLCFVAVLLRVLARSWLLQLTAALSEPISDTRITAFISDLSEAMTLLLGALTCAMVSFVIYLTMMIRAGNIG